MWGANVLPLFQEEQNPSRCGDATIPLLGKKGKKPPACYRQRKLPKPLCPAGESNLRAQPFFKKIESQEGHYEYDIWLAVPALRTSAAGETAAKSAEELEALCREYDLDPEQQISLIDQMEGSCSLSGAAAFSIGVYFGMQFASNPLFSELNKMMEPYQIE